MGTTAATLHLLRPAGAAPDYAALLKKAYAKLGWAPPKRGEAATRRAVLVESGPDWVTLHDSACAALDDGTLKELAALLGKALGSAAAVTTVLDSDAFGFLLFDKGKQVDAAGDGMEEAGVKQVRGKRQAALWGNALAQAALRRVLAGEPVDLPEPAEFLARAKAAEALETAFAEERLAAWCALAGLPAEAATATAEAVAERPVLAEIALVAKPGAVRMAATAPAGRELRVFDSPDDCPWHEFHPAPWPCVPGATAVWRWLVTCRGGGIRGLALRLDIDRAEGAAFRLREVHLRALPFFNGQATSLTPLAEWPHAVTAAEAEAASLRLETPDFGLRDPAPGSRSMAILILRIGLEAPDTAGAEVTIRPALEAEGEPAPFVLPPLRLRATASGWVPAIAVPGPENEEALLRLNAPSVHSAVAILPESAAALAASRRLFEQVLDACRGAGLHAAFSTERFMTASAHVGRARHAMPLPDLQASKAWTSLFDPASRIQTLRLGIAPEGAPAPLAGLVMQASLRTGTLLGLDGAEADGTLSVGLWMKPEGAAALGLDWVGVQREFRTWMAAQAPLQGWEADCAWLPLFDRADSYEHTPYEMLGTSAEARMRVHDAEAARAWRLERLKFMAPRLWLGAELLARIDRAALAAAAELTPRGEGVEALLRPGVPIGALEAALRPILPEAR